VGKGRGREKRKKKEGRQAQRFKRTPNGAVVARSGIEPKKKKRSSKGREKNARREEGIKDKKTRKLER